MNGVVHVGGHEFEELQVYLAEYRSPIIFFEPQVLDCDLALNFSRLVNIALSDKDENRTLYIPQRIAGDGFDTQAASCLQLIPGRARDMGWTETPCKTLDVRAMRFDTWAKHSGYQRGSCTLLVVDVQGMEMQVLEGFGDHLRDFERLTVECSQEPIWEGGASASQVEEYLLDHGFKRFSPILPCGDVEFWRMAK